MKKQLKAIVLGGTDDHIALIENLKDRSYYTILIDYYDDPPAKQAADIHIKESTLNEEKILEIAKGLGVDLVISTCIDQALLTCCYVAEKLNLPAPFSYKTALNVTNKGYMKNKMIESGIPTSKYCLVEEDFDLNTFELQLPVMVKPVDSNGSFGVKKANNIDELKYHLKSALSISRMNKAIIEEYKKGIEVGIDCFIQNNKANIIMMGQVLKKSLDESTLLIYQTIIPTNISEVARKKIEDIANQIAKSFQLDNVPLLLQTIVNEDEVSVIEFSPRVGGASKHRSIKMITQFDILNATVESFLGIKPNLKFYNPAALYSRNHIYANPGIFGGVKYYEELIEEGIIEEFVFFKTKGMEIGKEMASRNRIGSFLVKANNNEELFNKIEKAVNALEVYDIKNKPIMRKDIFQGTKI
ncbi:carbamoyl-phosphate synthase large chain [Clostridium tetani]|nr:hypothetical protein LA33_03235 [Clostridium tetani ATCC 9441]RXM74397.1 ATP-grasp domain-containing protein [Clostridium tetani]SUY66792.1 carbamoyl-phosphate synthase large chain [Clostridium tetani]